MPYIQNPLLLFRSFCKHCRSYGAPYSSRWTPAMSKHVTLPPPTFLLTAYGCGHIQHANKLHFLRLRAHRNLIACYKNKTFPATGPLTYVRIDIFGSLIESNNGNTALLVIIEHFTKLTKTAPLCTKTAQDIASAFTTH